MVLESLIGRKAAEKKPWEMFFFGVLYSSFAVILSLWIFKEQSSLIMVFLTVFACIPLIHKAIIAEEKKESLKLKEIVLLKEHWKVLKFLTYLFMGFIVSLSLWYIFLPGETVQILFSTQTNTIQAINSQISGGMFYVFSGTGESINSATINPTVFTHILANNLKVLLLCIFFSFFYGAGAIFILTWNATVISAAIGNFVRANISSIFHISYFSIYLVGILKYMTHGIFEILAYFIGGLAGGIISVAVIRHEISTDKFRRVLADSFDLIIIAIVILFLGALIEVFVTPTLFG